MPAYRITEIDSRIVVGTEQEPVLICTSLDVARRVIADAPRAGQQIADY